MFHETAGELDRREFLAVMAASLAFTSLTGCSGVPPEKIVPYVRTPEELLPGKPIVFATSMPSSGYGVGLMVTSHEGRPIKIEGNPDHPASLGSTDVFAQASLLTLYDPDRAQTVSQNGRISTWDAFITTLGESMNRFQANGGEGFRILTETVTSPTLSGLLAELLTRYPAAVWHQYEPVHHDNSRAGARLSFGRYVDTRYNFETADVIVSLDSDFLSSQPGNLHYTRKFATRRKMMPGERTMNRLYVIESGVTITGAMADHRFALRSSNIAGIAQSMVDGSPQQPWLETLLQDLEDHRGRSIVIAGEIQPPEVHAIAHLMNSRLGNIGKTVFYTEPVQFNPVASGESLAQLTKDMAAGRVDTLVMLGVNPAYSAPADFEFAKQLSRVPLRIHQSLYFDETSQWSHWHIPETHYLESWGDVCAWDGTASIIQPLIVPLYKTRTGCELLAAMLGNSSLSNYEIVRSHWQKQHRGADFEKFWTEAVRSGVIPDSATMPVSISVAAEGVPKSRTGDGETVQPNDIEIVFRPDATVFDGRWANNSWLQELPKPLTKLTWDNAALMNAATASRLGVRRSSVIEISAAGRSVQAAVLIMPGCAENSITLTLGYGRRRCGRVGTGRGYDAYALRTSSAPWILKNAGIRNTGKTYLLATTQDHHELHERHVVQHATAEEYTRHPNFLAEAGMANSHETLLPEAFGDADYAWGMAIDLSACVGCNACVVACQAENNIPVAGKDQVINSREMHWLRIDTYFHTDPGGPAVYFEPMLCQHCENAPCEVVCPVEATSHSAEGINEMTYNRCVGTRFCSNNCPYKVRRFNFYQYAEWNVPQLKLLYNPDVTVRSRGVMEKCTYCVQRINRARIQAKVEDRKIRDGEVVTACQGACPANAIVFGNLKDNLAAVSKWKAEPRNFGVLAELNTRPRTTYLAKLTNPNPALSGSERVGNEKDRSGIGNKPHAGGVHGQ
jgi:molybdopterin-containing oxidoreductase family iron-sulfur binding subunit